MALTRTLPLSETEQETENLCWRDVLEAAATSLHHSEWRLSACLIGWGASFIP